MVHPAVAVEQFMLHFLNQWHGGFQPSLTLNAKPNGDITVSYNVSAVLKNSWMEDYPGYGGCSSHSSGRGAR